MRVIFSTKNPIETLHLLNTTIPYATFVDFLEYQDVYDSLKDQAEIDAKNEAEIARAKAKASK